MGCEEGQVVGEGVRGGLEDGEGREGFFVDGAEEAALGGGGYEGLKGGLELLGGWREGGFDQLGFLDIVG